MAGEGFAFALAHRRRPAGLNAAGAQIVHEVAHIEQWPDIGRGVPLATVAQNMAAFFDDFGRQRQIAADDQIAG